MLFCFSCEERTTIAMSSLKLSSRKSKSICIMRVREDERDDMHCLPFDKSGKQEKVEESSFSLSVVIVISWHDFYLLLKAQARVLSCFWYHLRVWLDIEIVVVEVEADIKSKCPSNVAPGLGLSSLCKCWVKEGWFKEICIRKMALPTPRRPTLAVQNCTACKPIFNLLCGMKMIKSWWLRATSVSL